MSPVSGLGTMEVFLSLHLLLLLLRRHLLDVDFPRVYVGDGLEVCYYWNSNRRRSNGGDDEEQERVWLVSVDGSRIVA